MDKRKVPVSMRLAEDVAEYLELLRINDAVNKTAYIEKLVREDMRKKNNNDATIAANTESLY